MPAKAVKIVCIACTAALLPLAAARIALAEPAATTLPSGFSIAQGSVSTPDIAGNTMTLTQTSDRAVIDWQSFNIGRDATVEFKQDTASSITVNRVSGGSDPTQIYGQLKANGRVVILDTNGVFFGSTAKVDVGGLLASTGQIVDAAGFQNGGALTLTQMDAARADAAIDNAGQITAAEGGLVALVAPAVRNSGIISAHLGQVTLASGRTATVDFAGDGLIQIAVTQGLNQNLTGSQIGNSGSIHADGGQIYMTARAGAGLVSRAINNTGVVSAQRASQQDGKIVLSIETERQIFTPPQTHTMQNAVYAGTHADIQAVIDTLAAAGTHNLYLAGGTYHQTLTLHTGIKLRGDQISSATIYGDGTAVPALCITGNDVTVEGLTINTQNGSGLYASAVQGLHILRNTFVQHGQAAIELVDSAANLLNNLFNYSGDAGAIHLQNSRPVNIQDSLFSGSGVYAVKTNSAAGVTIGGTMMLPAGMRELLVSPTDKSIDDNRLRAQTSQPAAPQKDVENIIIISADADVTNAAQLAAIAPAAGGACDADDKGCETQ